MVSLDWVQSNTLYKLTLGIWKKYAYKLENIYIYLNENIYPENTRRWHKVVLMLMHRLQRWTNIKTITKRLDYLQFN